MVEPPQKEAALIPANIARVEYGEGSAENVARGYDSYLAVSMEVSPTGCRGRAKQCLPIPAAGGPRPGTSQTPESHALTFSGELSGQLVRQLRDWSVS